MWTYEKRGKKQNRQRRKQGEKGRTDSLVLSLFVCCYWRMVHKTAPLPPSLPSLYTVRSLPLVFLSFIDVTRRIAGNGGRIRVCLRAPCHSLRKRQQSKTTHNRLREREVRNQNDGSCLFFLSSRRPLSFSPKVSTLKYRKRISCRYRVGTNPCCRARMNSFDDLTITNRSTPQYPIIIKALAKLKKNERSLGCWQEKKKLYCIQAWSTASSQQCPVCWHIG